MPWKVTEYSVEITIEAVIPAFTVREIIREHIDPSAPGGYRKIDAIKALRSDFTKRTGQKLGLRDAMEIIEEEAGFIFPD